MSNQAVAIRLTVIVVIGIVISYLLARSGEPQSVWLWRDVFNIIP